MERETICFPNYSTRGVLQHGDRDFQSEINRLYTSPENDALEMLVQLKSHLPTLTTDEYWSALTEGISKLLGADMSFVSKRILVDEQNTAVEMPPIGEPGSCLMATAIHYCKNDGSKHLIRQTKYSAYDCPCAYMRHDKVFLIPGGLNDFITDNPNQMPIPAETYIAVPLLSEGKPFAHFGALWSKDAEACRKLSWASIEMILHSLEDSVQHRLLQGANFGRPPVAPPKIPSVIPHDIISAAQSLRPYAGSLSHELRTPMQGIVGMLDVMYATVQEAVETQVDPTMCRIFADLKENIQVVQDSSRRAVEAADNVVHAYDMDMSVPEAPPYPLDDPESASPFSLHAPDRRPEIFVAGSDLPLSRKRRRDEAFSRESSDANSAIKLQKVENARATFSTTSEPSQEVKEGLQEAERLQLHAHPDAMTAEAVTVEDAVLAASTLHASNRTITPGLRHTNMREIFQYVINEGLKLGGRPDSALAQETALGEQIEVRSRGSDGTTKTKTIDWTVDPNMPHTMFIDERDLTKLIGCVFLNAIKFTDQHGGHVGVHARMSSRGRYASIKISDNGPGIPAEFLPKLFKAFARENESITRQSEGLGLGLMVAQGIARKLGGDLVCTRAVQDSPDHGSEFEIKVPVMAGETISRPPSPFGSPLPRRATLAPISVPKTPPFPPTTSGNDSPASPAKLFNPPHYDLMDEYSHMSSPPSPRSHVRHQSLTASAHNVLRLDATSAPPTPPPSSTFPAVAPVLAPTSVNPTRPLMRKSVSNPEIDRNLAHKYPLTFLVAEDNKINRKLLVSMLSKFGYSCIHEAHDGAEAVRQVQMQRGKVDVVLMDLWMPLMDGYEATERILSNGRESSNGLTAQGGCNFQPTVLAVTADVTEGAQERATKVGMKGFMTKPYKLHDLQRLITEYCAQRTADVEMSTPPIMVS